MENKEEYSPKESIKEFITGDVIKEKFPYIVVPLFKELLIQLADDEILRTKEDVTDFLNYLFCDDIGTSNNTNKYIRKDANGNIIQSYL